MIQTFISSGASGGGAFAVDRTGSGGVCADSDVGVHGAHVGIIQDEVRVVIMELTFILIREKWKETKKEKQKSEDVCNRRTRKEEK